MNIVDIIIKKKDKLELTSDEIEYVIKGYLDETIKDYQMSSLLMAIVLNGMNDKEILSLTKSMVNNSKTLNLTSLGSNVVDKHSTGGVGDKTTLIIAPLVASCGVKVAKMSGRGLGYTGGTIDKLESISGIKTSFTTDEFINGVNAVGCMITSQTQDIAMADKKIYALRDVTGTTMSIPLIASSIMSKKIALGVKKLVLDIKVGKGALIKNKESGIRLANIMRTIGEEYGISIVSLITNMDIPLGDNIGNSLEVQEAIDILQNKKENNLSKLCIELSTHMVSLGLDLPIDEAREKVNTNLKNGNAYQKFLEFISYQGGDINTLKEDDNCYILRANRDGYITNMDALELGKLSVHLGAGRINKEDNIDYNAGIVLLKHNNEPVKRDEIVMKIYTKKSKIEKIDNLFTILTEKEKEKDLIYHIIK